VTSLERNAHPEQETSNGSGAGRERDAPGRPHAPVHIVEFLDPACETCRQFYPYVKELMKNNPGRVRLSIRMVAFHPNSDVAVQALEASKAQGKFWEVLECLLASQPRWVVQHRVDPDRLWAQLRTLDVDFARLQADMQSAAVLRIVSTCCRSGSRRGGFREARRLRASATCRARP
jgi:hypothetical protein